MKKFLLIIPILLIFTGCTDYKELNNIAIVTGIAVDMEDDKYKVSILISNSNSSPASMPSVSHSIAKSPILIALR